MTEAPARSGRAGRVGLAVLLAVLLTALLSLGTWQVHRRSWKLALISRVEQRVNAPAVDAPGPAQWPQITAASDEYRHVSVTGRFLHDRETLVQASTELGSGYWVLTPLQRPDGSYVLINRGFVSPEHRDRAARRAAEPDGDVTVTGLLRISEPGGGFLRHNDPDGDRWYSRDVQAIAARDHLSPIAPYFIDEARRARPPWPVGGLTVIAFHNNHLVYAITWYGLALMAAYGLWRLFREDDTEPSC